MTVDTPRAAAIRAGPVSAPTARSACDRAAASSRSVPRGHARALSPTSRTTRVAWFVGEQARAWPRGTLRELAAALSFADLAVGADTGPVRIAAALGVPTVTLFGPSWHGRYGQPPPHKNLQGYPGCPQRLVSDFTQQPCWYAGVCTLEDHRWRSCLEDIPVEDVLAAAAPLLENQPEPAIYGTFGGGGAR